MNIIWVSAVFSYSSIYFHVSFFPLEFLSCSWLSSQKLDDFLVFLCVLSCIALLYVLSYTLIVVFSIKASQDHAVPLHSSSPWITDPEPLTEVYKEEGTKCLGYRWTTAYGKRSLTWCSLIPTTGNVPSVWFSSNQTSVLSESATGHSQICWGAQ